MRASAKRSLVLKLQVLFPFSVRQAGIPHLTCVYALTAASGDTKIHSFIVQAGTVAEPGRLLWHYRTRKCRLMLAGNVPAAQQPQAQTYQRFPGTVGQLHGPVRLFNCAWKFTEWCWCHLQECEFWFIVFCVAFYGLSVWYSAFLINFLFLRLSHSLFSWNASQIFSVIPTFFPFLLSHHFSALSGLPQCVPPAPAYTNQISLMVLEHRRKELYTPTHTCAHMDWILFYPPLLQGFDSPTTASTGCEVQD